MREEKRLLSFILAVVMVVTMLPIFSFAEEPASQTLEASVFRLEKIPSVSGSNKLDFYSIVAAYHQEPTTDATLWFFQPNSDSEPFNGRFFAKTDESEYYYLKIVGDALQAVKVSSDGVLGKADFKTLISGATEFTLSVEGVTDIKSVTETESTNGLAYISSGTKYITYDGRVVDETSKEAIYLKNILGYNFTSHHTYKDNTTTKASIQKKEQKAFYFTDSENPTSALKLSVSGSGAVLGITSYSAETREVYYGMPSDPDAISLPLEVVKSGGEKIIVGLGNSAIWHFKGTRDSFTLQLKEDLSKYLATNTHSDPGFHNYKLEISNDAKTWLLKASENDAVKETGGSNGFTFDKHDTNRFGYGDSSNTAAYSTIEVYVGYTSTCQVYDGDVDYNGSVQLPAVTGLTPFSSNSLTNSAVTVSLDADSVIKYSVDGVNWYTETVAKSMTTTFPVSVSAAAYPVYVGLFYGNASTPSDKVLASVKINKATVKYDKTPQVETYSGEAKSFKIIDGNPSSATSYTIEYRPAGVTEAAFSTTKPIDAGEYDVKITCKDSTNYNDFSDEDKIISSGLTITKKTPTASDFNVTLPNNAVYDNTAKAAEVSTKSGIIGMGDYTVKYYGGGETEAPTNAGTYTVKVDVVEGENYTSATGIVLGSYTIAKANQTISKPSISTSSASIVKLVTAEPGIEKAQYACTTNPSIVPSTWQDSTTFAGLKPGTTYYFYQRYTGNDNYKAVTSEALIFETANHNHDWTIVLTGSSIIMTCGNTDGGHDGDKLVYTANIIKPEKTMYGDGKSQYASLSGDAIAIDKANELGIKYGKPIEGSDHLEYLTEAAVDAGDYVAYIYDVSYGTASVSYTIGKQKAFASTSPTGITAEFTGQPIELATGGATTCGKIVYSLTKDGDYSEVVPTGTSVGAYKLWFKVEGAGNYEDSEPELLNSTITAANLGDDPNNPNQPGLPGNPAGPGKTPVLDPVAPSPITAVTYTGIAHKPQLSISYGGKDLTEGVDYDIVYSNNINAGVYTAKVEVIYKGNYTGSSVRYFTINKANYDMSGVSFVDNEVPYDEAEHSLAIGGILPTGADGIQVTVSYTTPGQIEVGKKTITASFATTSTNYNVPESMKAVISVTKAAIDASSVIAPVPYTSVYDGSYHVLTSTGSCIYGTMKYSFFQSSSYQSDALKGKNAGTYDVWYMVEGDENHSDFGPVMINPRINPADRQMPEPDEGYEIVDYDDNHNPIIALETENKNPDGTPTEYEIAEDEDFTKPVDTSKPLDPNKLYYIRKKAQPQPNNNYNPSPARAFTLNGEPREQITISVEPPTGGTVSVSHGGIVVGSNALVYKDTVLHLSATPSAGYKFVSWYANGKAFSGDTYTVSEKLTLKAVFQFDSDKVVAVPTAASFVYDGTEKIGVPEIENIVITGTPKATDAGVYFAKVKPADGYVWPDGTTGEKTISWVIKKGTQPAPTVESPQVPLGDPAIITSPLQPKLVCELPSGEIIEVTNPAIIFDEPGDYKLYYPGDENHEPSDSVIVTVTSPNTVKTEEPKSITTNSAILVASLSGSGIESYGFEFAKRGSNNKQTLPVNTNNNGIFELPVDSLDPDTEYVVRAYIEIDGKKYYGDEIVLRTEKAVPDQGDLDVIVYTVDPSIPFSITVEEGNTVLSTKYANTQTTTPFKGTAAFDNLPDGYYNIVLRTADYTETRMIQISGGKTAPVVFNVPKGNLSTVVKVKTADTPDAAVEGLPDILTSEDKAKAKNSERDVEVKLDIEKKTEQTADGASSIKLLLGENDKVEMYLDLSLYKTTKTYSGGVMTSSETKNIGKSNSVILRIAIPYKASGENPFVIRYHNGEAEKLTQLTQLPNKDKYVDGTYYVDDEYIFVYANEFSTYAICYATTPVVERSIHHIVITKPAIALDTGVQRWLNIVDHNQYMQGYDDDTIRPQSPISRAEVAAMFYRLLLDQDVEVTNKFSDVKFWKWYSEPIEKLADMGIITGYEDGTYNPMGNITRAEFTAIAVRFAYGTDSNKRFSDVDANWWAEDYIATAAEYGWIEGYEDGTFRPRNTITRAEAAAIINRMLLRSEDEKFTERNAASLNQFLDLTNTNAWYYSPLVEATNSHDYSHKADGVSETWYKLNK